MECRSRHEDLVGEKPIRRRDAQRVLSAITGKKAEISGGRSERGVGASACPSNLCTTGDGEHHAVGDMAALHHVEESWRRNGKPLREPGMVRIRRATKSVHARSTLRMKR